MEEREFLLPRTRNPKLSNPALKWLTQEVVAKNLTELAEFTTEPEALPKHVQPEEGHKEPPPRAIKFRESRVDTTI